jgi:hypothetical protein
MTNVRGVVLTEEGGGSDASIQKPASSVVDSGGRQRTHGRGKAVRFTCARFERGCRERNHHAVAVITFIGVGSIGEKEPWGGGLGRWPHIKRRGLRTPTSGRPAATRPRRARPGGSGRGVR